MNRGKQLGLGSGIGLVIAATVGAGVFVSTGFMAQAMGPAAILAAWGVGALLALAGARAYAVVATQVPRSGGEYRYLSELWHPSLGYLAGWASLLVGFSAPVAINALAAASFASTLVPADRAVPSRALAAGLIVALTLLHAIGARPSRWTQNLLVAAQLTLVLGFVAMGLALGSHAWPSWTPPGPPPPTMGAVAARFAGSLFYVAFAFSGWNTAAYAAGEFARPRRDVPRAMLLGAAAVAILYLLLNWVFVANLTPAQASAALEYETSRITLGHVVARRLVGPAGAAAVSVLALVAFVASMSAMTFAGPRVYAAMARDGFLPRALVERAGHPPVVSGLVQGTLALVIVFTHTLQQALVNVSAILMLFSGLTALSVFRFEPKPSVVARACGALYATMAAFMLYFGLRGATHLLRWLVLVAAVALGAYALSSRSQDRRGR